MTVSVQKVDDRVRELINDKSAKRWTEPEMLMWISDGRRELASYLPAVFSKSATVIIDLDPGAFQQISTPSSAYAITAITHNVGANGVPGKAIRETSRELVDSFASGWINETGVRVQNWMRDVSNPIAFWVFPAVPGGKVSATLRLSPPDVSAMTEEALPFEQYLNPLVNYVMHRLYAKDAEVAQNAALSSAYLQLFVNAVSVKE